VRRGPDVSRKLEAKRFSSTQLRLGRARLKSGKGQAVAAVVRRCWKHSLQRTGRPCVGLKGTVVSLPQAEQLVRVSTRGRDAEELGPAEEVRLDLHALQRLGSFLNCLSWKKSCSPAVKTNSAPQSMHFKTLSWNSMESCSLQPATPKPWTGITCNCRQDRTESPKGQPQIPLLRYIPQVRPATRIARGYGCKTAARLR